MVRFAGVRSTASLLAHLVEHLRCDVRRPHLADVRRKEEGGVPGAGGHVQHLPAGLRVGERQQSL